MQLVRRTTDSPVTESVRIVKEQALLQGMAMNSHNTKTGAQAKITGLRVKSDHEDVRVITSNLQEAAELSISDDPDMGGDPYNSTGQHIVLKIKRDLPD